MNGILREFDLESRPRGERSALASRSERAHAQTPLDRIKLSYVCGSWIRHEAIQGIENPALNRSIEPLQIPPSRRRDLMRPGGGSIEAELLAHFLGGDGLASTIRVKRLGRTGILLRARGLVVNRRRGESVQHRIVPPTLDDDQCGLGLLIGELVDQLVQSVLRGHCRNGSGDTLRCRLLPVSVERFPRTIKGLPGLRSLPANCARRKLCARPAERAAIRARGDRFADRQGDAKIPCRPHRGDGGGRRRTGTPQSAHLPATLQFRFKTEESSRPPSKAKVAFASE